MDKYPKTSFVCSPETEAERIIHAARQTANGFYQQQGFVVVPRLSHPGRAAEVVLPPLDYASISSFWPRVKKLWEAVPMVIPEKLKNEVRVVMGDAGKPGFQPYEKASQWGEVENQFWNWLDQAFPKLSGTVDTVEVRVTGWGSICSFSSPEKTPGQQLVVYLRQDAHISHIAEAVLTALLMPHKQERWWSWRELETAVDILMTLSAVGKLWPKYRPTVGGLVKVSKAELRASAEYLALLGVPLLKPELELNGKKIYVHGRPAETFLSQREEMILAELLKNKGEIVLFEVIMELMWPREDQGSIWAMNKAIQRIRLKLKAVEINGDRLMTVRKRGYVWKG